MRKLSIALFAVFFATSFTAGAGEAPTIGGGATISANIGSAGVVNFGGGVSGFQGTTKQAIASVLSGKVGGALKIDVNIGKAGVVNVGIGASGAKVTACQSIGTIGSDCGGGGS